MAIGSVLGSSASVNVNEVQFRSTVTPVTELRSLGALDDLVTTANGSIKVRVDAGTLSINEGSDNDNVGVRAGGTGDILLRAYGANSDVRINNDGLAGGLAQVSSGSGHITVRAQDDILLDAEVFTTGSGTIYLRAENGTVDGPLNGIDINRAITSGNGDILIDSSFDISVDAPVTSTNGDIGLIAGNTIAQNSTISSTTGAIMFDTPATLRLLR